MDGTGQENRRRSARPLSGQFASQEVSVIVGVIGSGSIGPDLAYGFLSASPARRSSRSTCATSASRLDAGVAHQGYADRPSPRARWPPRPPRPCSTLVPPGSDLAACEYVLEAATEDLKIKQVLSSLERW